MPTARLTPKKPDLTPALRQALESVLKRAAPAPVAPSPGPAVPAATRVQKRPILQPDLRSAPARVAPPAVKAVKTKRVISKTARAAPALPPVKTLKELLAVKLAIETRARLAAEREAARQLLEAKLRAEKELFSRAVGPVKALPLNHRPGHRAALPPMQTPPIAVQHQRDELAVMREAISDEFDVETLLDTDESLSYRRSGMGPDVIRKLRRGGWAIQAQLDLHGLRRDDAREALVAFIKDATKMGWRCVRVVHGKGLGSPGKTPVLKGRVQSWLIQKNEVLAFVQARPAQGGAGALVVLLGQT
jgi:DNA-nicking Smr family endonuclease